MSFGITTNKQRGDSRSTVTRRWEEAQLRSDSAVLTINGLTSQSEPKVQKTIIHPHPVKMLGDRMLLFLLLLMKYWPFRELQNASEPFGECSTGSCCRLERNQREYRADETRRIEAPIIEEMTRDLILLSAFLVRSRSIKGTRRGPFVKALHPLRVQEAAARVLSYSIEENIFLGGLF